jgi:lipopolysaccharide transport system permease protein
MVGVIEGFRWALLGSATNPLPLLAVSSGVTLLLVIGGLAFFKKVEDTFADLV